ncbi:unnamed protein product, partial [marine sediment metagenome]
SAQVKDYVYGLYGKSPASIDPEVQKIVLKGYERGEEPVTCRAADMIEPELEKAKEATEGIAKDIGDVLIYALYPTTGMAFLKAKYGMAPSPPTAEKPKTLEDIKREDELIARAKAGKLMEKAGAKAPTKGLGLRTFNVFVADEYYKVEVEAVGGSAVVASPAPVADPPPAAPPVAEEEAPAPPSVELAEGEAAISAPMPGMVIRYQVEVGAEVKAGDIVVILEAMKMENPLPAPIAGKVKAINFNPGDKVAKDDVLAIIGV